MGPVDDGSAPILTPEEAMRLVEDALGALEVAAHAIASGGGSKALARCRTAAIKAAQSYGRACAGQEREECARLCERIRDERFAEFGITESDTNASYYPAARADLETRDEEDEDLAIAIRARATTGKERG